MRLFRPVGGHREKDDGALLRAVAAGDQAALADLYDRHAGWPHARLPRRCADPEVGRPGPWTPAWTPAAGCRSSPSPRCWPPP